MALVEGAGRVRMKALILNGADTLRAIARAAEDALAERLGARGYEVARRDLTAIDIPDCKGDFGCWTVTPGVCVQPGPHRDIARDLIQSDLAVWLTPVTFGGYSSALKRQLDHCVPLVSPRFTTVAGETHHRPRYERFPSLLAVGLLERHDRPAERVFARLVRRNVVNMYAPHFASPFVTRDDLPDLPAQADRWLDDLAASGPPSAAVEPLDLAVPADLPGLPPRRALLLVGSPRGSVSVSAAIAAHLAALLTSRGLSVSTRWIHRCLQEDSELRGLAGTVRESDLVVLATPLYVDSLPAPVTRAFETLAERTTGASPHPRFVAIVNCGFPEAVHADTALAISRLWARQAGLDWIGGLGVGAGGMFEGGSLADLGSRARNVRRALALAANAVAQGRVVPDEAKALAGTLAIPAWLYRFLGDWGFRRDARRHGTRSRLGDRPYAA
jgi:multimeric flavodoxin WrbA